MKKLFFSICFLTALLMLALPIAAETPDGLTPAEETVCDQLREDGVSKGLYGLCVAFCEAQDVADRTTPLTLEDLDSLKIEVPSARILENYNKRKQESDPEMPCVLVQESCPCFTKQEVQSIDGYDPDGLYMDTFYHFMIDSGTYNIAVLHERDSATADNMIDLFMFSTEHSDSYCWYTNNQTTPSISRVLRTGDDGTLTQSQWDTCYQLMDEQISLQ